MKHIFYSLFLLSTLLVSYKGSCVTQVYFKAEYGMEPDNERNYEATYTIDNYEIIKTEPNVSDASDLRMLILPLDPQSPAFDHPGGVMTFILSGPKRDKYFSGKFPGIGHYILSSDVDKPVHHGGFDYPAFCSGVGEVDIYEISYNADDVLTSIAADLYFRCAQGYNRAFFKIRYNSEFPLHLPEVHVNAGPNIYANPNDIITLDGSLSYTDNQQITKYQWTQIGGEPIELTNENLAIASITIPSERSSFDIYEFQLEATDNTGQTDIDQITVTIGEQNPLFRHLQVQTTANYHWQKIMEDETLNLNSIFANRSLNRGIEFINIEGGGYRSLIEINGEEYKDFKNFHVGGYPFVVANNLGALHLPTISNFKSCVSTGIPSRKSFYNILDIEYDENLEIKRFAVDYEHTCEDGERFNLKGKIRYNSFAPLIANHPFALAGPDRSLIANQKTFLVGMYSYSDDSFIQSYQWRQLTGPTLILEDANSPVATVKKNIILTEDVEAIFELAVTDALGRVSKDRVKVSIPSATRKQSHAYVTNNYNYYHQQSVTDYVIDNESTTLSLISLPNLNRGDTVYVHLLGFDRSSITINAGLNNQLVEGDFYDLTNHSNTELMNFSSSSSGLLCVAEEQNTDLTIKRINRNVYGEIDELAIDYVSYCNYSRLPTKGSIRINSDVPIMLNKIDVNAGNDQVIYEGEQISLVANIQHDKPVLAEWRVAYGPNITKTPIIKDSLFLNTIAPTVALNEEKTIVYHVRVWDEDGAFGEDYVAVTIKDKSSILDFVGATEFLDIPYVVETANFPTFGIRYANTAPTLSEIQYSEDIIQPSQLTPVIEVFAEEFYFSADIFIKTVDKKDLQLWVLLPNGAWQQQENYDFYLTDIENGWSRLSIILDDTHNLNTSDRYKIRAKFMFTSKRSSLQPPQPPTTSSGSGGGAMSLWYMLFLALIVFKEKRT